MLMKTILGSFSPCSPALFFSRNASAAVECSASLSEWTCERFRRSGGRADKEPVGVAASEPERKDKDRLLCGRRRYHWRPRCLRLLAPTVNRMEHRRTQQRQQEFIAGHLRCFKDIVHTIQPHDAIESS